jgi:hypothetical protein
MEDITTGMAIADTVAGRNMRTKGVAMRAAMMIIRKVVAVATTMVGITTAMKTKINTRVRIVTIIMRIARGVTTIATTTTAIITIIMAATTVNATRATTMTAADTDRAVIIALTTVKSHGTMTARARMVAITMKAAGSVGLIRTTTVEGGSHPWTGSK